MPHKTATSVKAGHLPQRLPGNFHNEPKLTKEQCGHLRHFHNLASLPDGDWSRMGSHDSLQEHDTSYRYQLSAMAYGAGAAHYHRLPAMRAIFKPLVFKLIHKMLRREVWGYWYMTSQSGVAADPDLKELRKPWADPVCKENIMYSGHLLLMVSLYSMLFNDDEFDKPDSISFEWDPLFFGMGPESFNYNTPKLQQTIIDQMEQTRWMGVCCEPNMVFIICNQFPLIAMRYNDIHNNTNVIDDVLPKYEEAWAKRGMVAENGLYRSYYAPGRDEVKNAKDVSHSAWTSAFLAWNREMVEQNWAPLTMGFLHRTDNGRINIRPESIANVIREIVHKEDADPDSPDVIDRATKIAGGPSKPSRKYLLPIFGHMAQGMSEVVNGPDLDALLLHADTFLEPTWERGGLFYARRTTDGKYWDNEGNYVYGEPHTGNACIGYARLNVKGGQSKMWDHPWTRDEVDQRPWIDGIDLDSGVDCLSGRWDEARDAMIVVLRAWNGDEVKVKAVVRSLPAGKYGVYIDGERDSVTEVRDDESIYIELAVGGKATELVLLRAQWT